MSKKLNFHTKYEIANCLKNTNKCQRQVALEFGTSRSVVQRIKREFFDADSEQQNASADNNEVQRKSEDLNKIVFELFQRLRRKKFR
jgi:hypothetical protein